MDRAMLRIFCLTRQSHCRPGCLMMLSAVLRVPVLDIVQGCIDVVHLSRFPFHVVGMVVHEYRHWSSWPSFCFCRTNVAHSRF
jgi:hypothetical protein